jgi:hypothetical protein
MNYEFTVILPNLDEMTTDLANVLFAAGCDDSAIADVQKAGCVVRKVEIEPQVVLA